MPLHDHRQTNDLAAADGDGGTDYAADRVTNGQPASHDYTTYEYHDERGKSLVEKWLVEGMDHAWSRGASGGEYSAPGGPDASQIIWDFFTRFTRNE